MIASLLLSLFLQPQLQAMESDQYSCRLQPPREALDVMDARVNDRLVKLVSKWNKGYDKKALVKAVKRALGFGLFFHNTELWINRTKKIEKVNSHKDPTIYDDASFSAGPVLKIIGVDPTIMVNGTRIGSDKFGHFFSLGYHYFVRAEFKGKTLDEILAYGRDLEVDFFGQRMTGVHSNADLVSNFEGYLFYKSLFEDNIVPGKPALIAWTNGKPHLQRPFSWLDHVNDYWDEALNPSGFGNRMAEHMRKQLCNLCDLYRLAPEQWTVRNDVELAERYKLLGMVDNTEFRLENLCK